MQQDIDTVNLMYKERQQEQKEINEEKNAILKMSNPKKKQARWNTLFPKLAIDGLSAEELARPF